MGKQHALRLLSPWDQMPVMAVLALIFIYMVTLGELPSLAFFKGVDTARYLSPVNLWREAMVIGCVTWGLLWFMSVSLFVFAGREAAGIMLMLEPIRGMIPAGAMAVFFGLLASLTKGRHWVYIGMGLLLACVLIGFVAAIRRLPQVNSVDGTGIESSPNERWIMGIFYISKDNHRIIVPRRKGRTGRSAQGVALNLAHGRAWGLLVTGFLLPLGLALYATFGGL